MDACPCCGETKGPSAELCSSCAAELESAAVSGGTSPVMGAVRSSGSDAPPSGGSESDKPVRCRKCGYGHAPGVLRCYRCDASLRPVFLGVVTVAGPILLVLFSLALIDEFRHGTPPMLSLLLNIAQFAVLLGLRFGRNWAWIAIHVLWLVNLALLAGTEIHATGTVRVTLIYGFVVAMLWTYMHSPSVRAFCSVGRRRKER